MKIDYLGNVSCWYFLQNPGIVGLLGIPALSFSIIISSRVLFIKQSLHYVHSSAFEIKVEFDFLPVGL